MVSEITKYLNILFLTVVIVNAAVALFVELLAVVVTVNEVCVTHGQLIHIIDDVFLGVLFGLLTEELEQLEDVEPYHEVKPLEACPCIVDYLSIHSKVEVVAHIVVDLVEFHSFCYLDFHNVDCLRLN